MVTQKESDEAERRIEELCKEGIRMAREYVEEQNRVRAKLEKLWTLYQMLQAGVITESQTDKAVEHLG